jgi:phosphomannomutase
LQKAIGLSDFKPEMVWGELIEDRGSQITFSAIGQQAPLEEKKRWDPDFTNAVIDHNGRTASDVWRYVD